MAKSLPISDATGRPNPACAESALAMQVRAGASSDMLGATARRLLATSVSDQLQAQAKIQDQTDGAPSMFITDRDGVILWVNAPFTHLTGYRADEAIGRNARLLSSGEQGRRFYRRMWECIRSGQVWTAETVDCDRFGFRYVIEQSIYPLTQDGTIRHYLSVHHEAADQRVRRMEAERRRHVDPATGLLTATSFLDRVGDRIRQVETAGRSFVVISLQFKQAEGDLGACVAALQKQLGRADCAGYFGAANVALLINDVRTAKAACAWVSKALQSTCADAQWSAGVAIFPDHGCRADHLWRIADDNILASAS